MALNQSLFYYLDKLSAVAAFIPLVSVVNQRKFMPLILKPIIIYVISAILIEVLTHVLVFHGESNNHYLRAWTVVEFSLLSLFYYYFFKSEKFSPLFLAGIPLIIFIEIADIWLNGINSFDSLSTTCESTIFIFYALFLFFYILKKLIFENLLDAPVFWINTAILVYFSGNLLLFTFNNFLESNYPGTSHRIWSFLHTFINIVYNILLAIGIWKTRVK